MTWKVYKEPPSGLGKTQRRIMEILDNIEHDMQIRPYLPDPYGVTRASIPFSVVYPELKDITGYYSVSDYPVTKSQVGNVYRAIRALKRRGLVDTFVGEDLAGNNFVWCKSLVRETLNPIKTKGEKNMYDKKKQDRAIKIRGMVRDLYFNTEISIEEILKEIINDAIYFTQCEDEHFKFWLQIDDKLDEWMKKNNGKSLKLYCSAWNNYPKGKSFHTGSGMS